MKTILIVDDEQEMARGVARAIRLHGHMTMVANSGAKALLLLFSHLFDAVLCDLMLPDMTGLDVLEQAPVNMRSRFVFYTGTRSGPERERLNKLGPKVLEKPSSNDDIFRALGVSKD